MTVQTNSAAVARGSGAIASIIVGGGYEHDGDDSTYVESVMRKSGTSSVIATQGYFWGYTADAILPQNMTVRVRVTLVDITFVDAFTVGGFEVQIARASDGLVLSSVVPLNGIETLPLNVPTWFEVAITATAGVWEALRTGSWTGYGPTQLAVGWGGSPGFPSGAIGDEARIRVHEMEIIATPVPPPPPPPPTPGFWGVLLPPPPPDTGGWTILDLSTAQFGNDGGPAYGKYDPALNGGQGAIVTNGGGGWPDFWFPDLTVDPDKNYELEFTFDISTAGEETWIWLMSAPSQVGYHAVTWSQQVAEGSTPDVDGGVVRTIRIGPAGVEPNPNDAWWAASGASHYVSETALGKIYPLFETSRWVETRQIKWKEI